MRLEVGDGLEIAEKVDIREQSDRCSYLKNQKREKTVHLRRNLAGQEGFLLLGMNFGEWLEELLGCREIHIRCWRIQESRWSSLKRFRSRGSHFGHGKADLKSGN